MVTRLLAAGLLVLTVARVHGTITCPPNQQKGTDANVCTAIVAYPDPVVGGAVPIGCDPPSGSQFPSGTTIVSCGAFVPGMPPQIETCTFAVQVDDNQPPFLSCPGNITRGTDPGVCGTTIDFAPTAATDNCPGLVVTAAPPSGFFFDPLPRTVTITARDTFGNTASCSFSVKVNDTEAPALVCPTSIDVTLPPGECTIAASYPELTAPDNCDFGIPEEAEFSPPAGRVLPLGTTIVTASARDGAGNISACEVNFIARHANGVDCDADRCTDEGCSETGVCTFAERPPTTPDAILCNVDNLRDALNVAPEPECGGKCRARLERRLAKVADLIGEAQVGSPKKCRRRLAAMLRRAKALSGTLQKLAGKGKLEPTTRAQRLTSEAAALVVRGGVFAGGYCPGG